MQLWDHVCLYYLRNPIGGVMVGVLDSINGQEKTKDYKIGMYWFSTKQTILRRNSKDWLVRN